MKKKRLDIILPVYRGNLLEIEPSIETQISFYKKEMSQYDWKIVLAINGQNAGDVIKLAKKLNSKDKRISYDYTPIPGKGSGVLNSWSKSDADIISYMDIDLATNLKCFPALVSAIIEGHDVSVGSRYHPLSRVERSLKRKIVSLVYHKIFIKLVLGANKYTDAQCGFKAVNQKIIKEILPLIKNKNWFFESELMYFAQKNNFKIKEVPVDWRESKSSGVNLVKAIPEFIKCGFEMAFNNRN